MTKMPKYKNKLLLTSAILTYIAVAFSAIEFIIITFNLFGIVDIYAELLHTYVSTQIDVASEITFMSIELILTFFINLYFANFYMKGYKYRVYSYEYGRSLIIMGVFQILSSSALPAIFAIIAGAKMSSRKKANPLPNLANISTENSDINIPSYKMEAMKDAIDRLRDLKESGAISEEEFYATIDRIIEGK